jgi:hypothetical protein
MMELSSLTLLIIEWIQTAGSNGKRCQYSSVLTPIRFQQSDGKYELSEYQSNKLIAMKNISFFLYEEFPPQPEGSFFSVKNKNPTHNNSDSI